MVQAAAGPNAQRAVLPARKLWAPLCSAWKLSGCLLAPLQWRNGKYLPRTEQPWVLQGWPVQEGSHPASRVEQRDVLGIRMLTSPDQVKNEQEGESRMLCGIRVLDIHPPCGPLGESASRKGERKFLEQYCTPINWKPANVEP